MSSSLLEILIGYREITVADFMVATPGRVRLISMNRGYKMSLKQKHRSTGNVSRHMGIEYPGELK